MATTSTAAATTTSAAFANNNNNAFMAGAPNLLQDGARTTLVTLVEEHVTSLIRQAACVTSHCKRARTHHLSSSIESGGTIGGSIDDGGAPLVEPTTVRIVKRRLHAEDLNLALQWRGSEKLYATGLTTSSAAAAAAAAGNGSTITSGAGATTEHHYNKVVDLKEYLRSEMDFSAPHEVGLTVHWLAVDGQQPRIPQNPTEKTASRRGRAVAGLVHRVEQSYGGDDDYDEDDNLLVAADGMLPDSSSGTGGVGGTTPTTNSSSSAAAAALAAQKHKGAVQVSQLRAQLLSEELQLYFLRVTSTLERGGATPTARQQQDTALASVGRDTGIQELVPFLVDYLLQSHEAHVGNPEQSHVLVRLVQALLANPHLHLELHVSSSSNTQNQPRRWGAFDAF
jgi:transcription initiation factor TFIID subunit 6